jgi:cell division septum initiation protein DivIVA
MTAPHDKTPRRPPDEGEPIEHTPDDALDYIDQTVAQITPAEIEEHLHKVLNRIAASDQFLAWPEFSPDADIHASFPGPGDQPTENSTLGVADIFAAPQIESAEFARKQLRLACDKVAAARQEAKLIISAARDEAVDRAAKILSEAREKADQIIRDAQTKAEDILNEAVIQAAEARVSFRTPTQSELFRNLIGPPKSEVITYQDSHDSSGVVRHQRDSSGVVRCQIDGSGIVMAVPTELADCPDQERSPVKALLMVDTMKGRTAEGGQMSVLILLYDPNVAFEGSPLLDASMTHGETFIRLWEMTMASEGGREQLLHFPDGNSQVNYDYNLNFYHGDPLKALDSLKECSNPYGSFDP